MWSVYFYILYNISLSVDIIEKIKYGYVIVLVF